MPHVIVRTSVKDVQPSFLHETVKLVSTLTGKPVETVKVVVHPNTLMTFGLNEPSARAAWLYVGSIGRIGPSENLKYCKALCEHMQTQLGIEKKMTVIQFEDLVASNVGTNDELIVIN